ncbi:pentatricopeptide repeat-containing protein At3g18020-like [Triticum dicoccoides]|uniref:pentatricopeptide repeat-containing protein At3g18020-like n=1 Tax=Triticum dicoccoides TaxID=85692 RepID=UPI00188F0344|nr:pentatricopeptide repeat-containing protein At3g18020-like [Triticum dicoccoides]
MMAAAPQPEQPDLGGLVDALCASGRSAEAHHRVALLLSSASASRRLDAPTANGLLARLLRARTPLLTLRLVQAAPFVPSLPNYNRLLALLSSAAAPMFLLLAHRLLLRMRVPPSAVSYAALLDGYACAADPRAAQKLLDEMPRWGLAPSSLARTFLVKAFLRSRDVGAAMDLVDNQLWPSMERCHDEDQGLKNAAFANLVQCLCGEGFFHIVFGVAEEMPQRRCLVPDEFAYAQMIDSLCRAGQHHGASRIVYIMGKRGLCPSTLSYNCIVHGLCTSQKPGGRLRAYQLVMEGMRSGYRPREVTYKVLVEELCREKELAKAKDVLELMLQPQCGHEKPDEETRTRLYNMFLGALCAVDNPSEQLSVLVSMLQGDCKPDVITMNTVIHGFCKVGRTQEARKILDDMINGKFCAPDVVTFTTLISGYLDVGEHAEALHVLHTLMPRRRCAPNVVTYNSVLKGLFSLGLVDRAMQVIDEMKSSSIIADSVSHTVVIKGLCDAGQLEKAKAFWDNVVWPSGIHDGYVYSAILRGLCKLGKLEQACDFLYELADSGVCPSVVCYNILIDTACKQGLKKLAYQLVKELRRNGLSPDAVTWRILEKLHLYGNEEQEEEHQVPTFHVDQSSADDKVEPIVSTKNEMPSLSSSSSSEHLDEVCKNNNEAKVEEAGRSLEMTENPSDLTEPAKEQNYLIDNSVVGPTMDKDHTISDDGFNKQYKQPLREPLSEVARRVFGLL